MCAVGAGVEVSPFDRCDDNTIAVFNTAIAEARRLGHDYVGTEHLLIALVRHREVLPDAVATLLPGDVDVLTAALEDLLGGPPRDAELLKTLGIDLDAVRAAVRQTFGGDAIERLGRRRVHQPWQPWRRPSRRCMSLLAGGMVGMGVVPRVKRAFEYARRDADRRQRTTIDPSGLLLGMVEVEDALSNRLLQLVGVNLAAVRRALLEAAG
jgi:ATP-dependent Clp protease ATP-binding subunit ClpA